MNLTRAQWEAKGISLRTPPGLRILEIPADVGWDARYVELRASILTEFGFDSHERLMIRSDRIESGGTSYQISQYTKTMEQAEQTLAESLGVTTEMGKLALAEATELVKVLDRKQKDYGSNNIAKFGLKGVTVRLSDKIERLINLTNTGNKPEHESIEDTLGDTANYAIIGLLCQKGLWK